MTNRTADTQVNKNVMLFHQIAQDAAQLIIKQLLPRLTNLSGIISEGLFKKATGHSLLEVVQTEEMRHVFENIVVNDLIQELNNTAKNIEMSLLKSSGMSSEQMALKMREHYSSRTGLSPQLERMVKGLLAETHRHHHRDNTSVNAFNSNASTISNPNSTIGFYRYKIQRYLRSVLDGLMHSAMRQASRVAAENSLEQLEIAPTAHLESFALYKKLHQDQSLTRDLTVVNVAGQKEHMAFGQRRSRVDNPV